MSINGQLGAKFDFEEWLINYQVDEHDTLEFAYEAQEWRLIFKAIEHHDKMVELLTMLTSDVLNPTQKSGVLMIAKELLKELESNAHN